MRTRLYISVLAAVGAIAVSVVVVAFVMRPEGEGPGASDTVQASESACTNEPVAAFSPKLGDGDCVTSSVELKGTNQTVIGTRSGEIGVVDSGTAQMTRPPNASGDVTDLVVLFSPDNVSESAVSFQLDQGVGVFLPASLSVVTFVPNDWLLGTEGQELARALLTSGSYLHITDVRLVRDGQRYTDPASKDGARLGVGLASSGAVCADFQPNQSAIPGRLWCSDPVLNVVPPAPEPSDPAAHPCPANNAVDDAHHLFIHASDGGFRPDSVTLDGPGTYAITLISDEEGYLYSLALAENTDDTGARICTAYSGSDATNTITFSISKPGAHGFSDLLHPNLSGTLVLK